jgi:hypothetical protein
MKGPICTGRSSYSDSATGGSVGPIAGKVGPTTGLV